MAILWPSLNKGGSIMTGVCRRTAYGVRSNEFLSRLADYYRNKLSGQRHLEPACELVMGIIITIFFISLFRLPFPLSWWMGQGDPCGQARERRGRGRGRVWTKCL
jgi:hypothetical protein